MSANNRHSESPWVPLAVTTILSIQLLVMMEWIFFVTKPSFLSVLGAQQQLVVLVMTPLPFLVVATGLLIPVTLGLWLLRHHRRAARWWAHAGGLVPAAVLGSLYLLMADNFTNTLLGWSIQRSAGMGRVVAILLVLGTGWLGWRTAWAWRKHFSVHPRLGLGLAGACLAATLTALFVSGGGGNSTGLLGPLQLPNRTDPLPNILILGSDGLSANHLSAYGYERETTPYLEELVPFSLFCENAFANCDHTTGSLTSLLTGRLPTETRVTYPPDILIGNQAYRHLPGLLKRLGYFTEQICIRHYGDAFDVNMREGFDRAAFRNHTTAQVSSRLTGWVGQEPGLFLETIVDRIGVRLAHAAGREVLPSAFQEAVYADRLTGHTDGERFNGLVEVLGTAPEPFFVHTHFMSTHGAYFTPTTAHFSEGQTQDRDWMLDFYDDAILEFDVAVGDLVETLRQRGVLDNTLIVIYSDHGMASNARLRIPLMFIFPGGELTGRITANAQLLDIAPTLVDFLGMEIPTWMHGQSLLADGAESPRPVFSTGFRGDALHRIVPDGPFEVDASAAGPPFYSMGRVGLIVGQRAYSLDLVHPLLSVQDLPDHTAPVAEADLPSAAEAAEILLDHLGKRGWDVTDLPDPLPVDPQR